MMSPMKLVKKTSSIHKTELSMPRAFASRATQTKSAIFRTNRMSGIARNVLQQAQPAAGDGLSFCVWADAVPRKMEKDNKVGSADLNVRSILF